MWIRLKKILASVTPTTSLLSPLVNTAPNDEELQPFQKMVVIMLKQPICLGKVRILKTSIMLRWAFGELKLTPKCNISYGVCAQIHSLLVSSYSALTLLRTQYYVHGAVVPVKLKPSLFSVAHDLLCYGEIMVARLCVTWP